MGPGDQNHKLAGRFSKADMIAKGVQGIAVNDNSVSEGEESQELTSSSDSVVEEIP